MSDQPTDRELLAAPPSWYNAEDRAFHEWWYGHMRNDMMRPPLAGISHGTARYIWDAATNCAIVRAAAAMAGEGDK